MNDEVAIEGEALDRWMSGDILPGVRFSINQPVCVTIGPHAGAVGVVLSLHALMPEPCYLVETGDGNDLFLGDSALAQLEA